MEPSPKDEKWYSTKIRSPGLRYEIGLNIRTGYIVWKYGGFPCREYSDLNIARESYVFAVSHDERTWGDREYRDVQYFITPNTENSILHKQIMARHEAMVRKVKNFQIMKLAYRHKLEYHEMIFNSIVNLVQLTIESEEPLCNDLGNFEMHWNN